MPCPDFGVAAGARRKDMRVMFPGDPGYNEGPERCPACGRQRVFTISFDQQG